MNGGIKKIGVAGAGFTGAVLAYKLAKTGRFRIDVFDQRDHVGGNCHTSRDPKSGVMIHHYGPHIFHTSRTDVWQFVNQIETFGEYTNRVRAATARGVFSLPINLRTINQFFSKNFTPEEAEIFIRSLGDSSIKEPRNFEEQALKMMGRDLYENFFYGYTKKQWGVEPKELPASILKRLPFRFTDDDNYFNDTFQGIPKNGYTSIVEKLLDHPAIRVNLKCTFTRDAKSDYDHIFYTGPLDSYFGNCEGALGYRSLDFKRFDSESDFQGTAVVNYCDERIPYTRIHEHKFFAPWDSCRGTVYFQEFSKECTSADIPYYPTRLASDINILKSYVHLADREEKVTFAGRLGTYRYLDMHIVIGEALDLSKTLLARPLVEWPRFSVRPLSTL